MDKVGRNMFLSQEGFSSIDFTLLDRPSDSVMPASGSTGYIYTGDPSTQSIDYFNGAKARTGAEPLANQSLSEYGSGYMSSEAHKGNVRKDLYGQRQRQRQGVHDFFGQDNEQHSVPGDFSESQHSHYIHPPSLSGNSQGGLLHSLNSTMGGESMDTRRVPKDLIHNPTTVQIQDRNHQALHNHFQNTQPKLRHPIPMSDSMSSSPNSRLKGISDDSVVQYQNQNGRYSSTTFSQAGDGLVNDTKGYDFFENQLQWNGPSPVPSPSPSPSPSPAQVGSRKEGIQDSARASGMTKLQLLQKQALQVKKQQALEAQKQQAQKQQALEAQDLEGQRKQAMEIQKLKEQQQKASLWGNASEAQVSHAQHHQRALHAHQLQRDLYAQPQQQGFQSPNDLSLRGQPQQQQGFQSQNEQVLLRAQTQGFQSPNDLTLQSRLQQQGFQSQNSQVLRAQQQQQEGFQSLNDQLLRAQQQQRVFQSQNDQALLRAQQQGFQSQNDKFLQAQQQQQQDFQAQNDQAMLRAQQQGFHSQNAESLRAQEQGLRSQNDLSLEAQLQHQQGLQSENVPSLRAQQQQQSQNDLYLRARLQEQGFQSQGDQSLQGQQGFQSQNGQSSGAQQQQQGFQSQNIQPVRVQQHQQGFHSQSNQLLRVQQQQQGFQSQTNQHLRAQQLQQGFQPQYEQSLQAQQKQQSFQSQSDQSLRAHNKQEDFQSPKDQILLTQQGFQSRQEQLSQSPQKQQGFQSPHDQSSRPQHQQQEGFQSQSRQSLQTQQHQFQNDQSLQAQQQCQYQNDQSLLVQPQQRQGFQSQYEQSFQSQQQSFQPQLHEIWQAHQTQNLQLQQHLKKQQTLELQPQTFHTQQQIAMQNYQEPTIRNQIQPSVQPPQHLSMQPQPQHQILQHIHGMLQHSKQPSEPHLEFPETSYSALLHRPDTPPSRSQIGDETRITESDQDVSFPAVTAWAADGASYYQGLPNDFSMGQNRLTSQTFSGVSPTSNQDGSVNAQAYVSGAHNDPTENVNGDWRSFSSDSHLGKSTIDGGYSGNYDISEVQTASFGVRTDVSNELNSNSTFFAFQQLQQVDRASELKTDGIGVKNVMNTEKSNQPQMHSKLSAAQQPQQLRETSAPRNPMCNGTYNVNPLSQSQQHFQTLQMNQERIQSSLEQRENESNISFSRLSNGMFQSVENYGDTIEKNGRGWDSSVLQKERPLSPVHQLTETENIQTPMDMRSPSIAMTEGHVVSNQEILRNRLESGLKQCDGIVAPGFIKSPSLGPGRYALEKYNSPNNFVTDAGKLSRLARDGSSNIHNDNCQLGNKSEAAFGLSTPIKNLNIGNGQGLAAQLGHDKQTSIMNGINQEIQKPIRQGQAASQSANVLKVLGDRPTGKLISTVIEDPVALPHKNSLNSPMQREAMQQKADSIVSSTSLAQGRQSQTSHPPSPQHLKHVPEPSNTFQISQQADKPSWRNLSRIQAAAEEVPTTQSTGRSLNVDSPYCGAAIRGTRNFQVEVNQGSDVAGKRTLSQSGSAADIPNRWSPSKESTSSEVLPANFASFGPGLIPKSTIISPSMMPSSCNFMEGCGGSQMETRDVDSSFTGFQQARDNSGTSVSLIGQSPPTTDFARLPNYDSSNLHEMQNQHIINMALKQLESRGQTQNSVALATNLKRSPSEQPKSVDIQDKAFLSPVLMDSTKGVSDDVPKRDTIQVSQRPQTGNFGLVSSEIPSVPNLSIESQNNQFRVPYQEKASILQKSGLATSNMSLERRQASIVDNSRGNSLLQDGSPSYGQNNFQFANAADCAPWQADVMARRFESRPAFARHSQSVGQHIQMREKISEGPIVGDPTESPLGRKDTFLKPGNIPRNYVYSGKVSLTQQTAINSPIIRQHGSMIESKEVAQNALPSDETVKNVQQILQKQPVGNVMVSTTPSSYKEKDEDAVPVDADQTPRYIGYDQLLSRDVKHFVPVAHPGKPNDLLAQAQAFKYDSSKLYGNSSISIYNTATKEQTQAASFSSQGTSCLENQTEVRDRMGTFSGTNPAIAQLPLKINSYGIGGSVHQKKKKKQIPLLIPWHVTAAQPSNITPSSGEAERSWATATNRVPDKDTEGVCEDSTSDESRAKKRLKLTTQLMQQIFSPLEINGNNTLADNECAIYSVAKRALGDACRLAMSSEREAGSANNFNAGNLHPHGRASMANAVQCTVSFMEKAKWLDDEITRRESITTAMELKARTHELEKISIVNRLLMQHGVGFAMDSSSSSSSSTNLAIENKHISDIGSILFRNPTPTPEKYVTIAPMPRTLPDHAKCLSL